MTMILSCQKVSKEYNGRLVFDNISCEITTGQTLVISGSNGSGKTTLCKLLCGLSSPSQGKIKLKTETPMWITKNISRLSYLISPYLNLYQELTALENIQFFAGARNKSIVEEDLIALLKECGLYGWQREKVGAFSSGMKVRLKYVIAKVVDPDILITDEPFSNLDEKGIQWVDQILKSFQSDTIMILATNENKDKAYGDQFIELGQRL